jgi:hypothetical protein
MSHVIPKRKMAVRLRLVDGASLSGDVFLDYIDPVHRGEQTLLDLFNKDAAWLPLATPEGIRVVNRDRVLTVEPGPGVKPEMVRRDNAAVFRRERVVLYLPGLEIGGMIAMDLPDEFSRVSDFLNFPEEFFAVETADGPVLACKSRVSSLAPHEKPPTVPARDGDFEDRA